MKTEWLLWWGDGEHLRRQAKTKEELEKYMEKEFIKGYKFLDKSGKELPYDVKFNVDADKHCIEVDDFFIKSVDKVYNSNEKVTFDINSRGLVGLLECAGLYDEEVEYVYDDGDDAGGPFKTKITITKKNQMKKVNYKKFYNVSYEILLDMIKAAKISERELKHKYLTCNMPNSLKEVFDLMVGSASNAQRKSTALKYFGNNNKHYEYQKLLFDFDYIKVLNKYGNDESILMSEIKKICKSKGNKFCFDFARSIIDSAIFLSEFKDITEFKKFLKAFNLNIHTRLALPLLLKERIRGYGFALACNFLKEIGCTYYSKPDVHIMKVLNGVGLCKENELDAFITIDRIATGCKKTPYEVDKIIWLICSGTFYNSFDCNNKEIKLKGRRDELIKKLKTL